MKKIFLIAAAALTVLASCKKDPTPTHEIVLESSEVVDLGDNNFTTVKFNSQDPWAARVYDLNAEAPDYVKVDGALSGEAGEGAIKLTVNSLADGETGRIFFVSISNNAGKEVTVAIMQGKVFLINPETSEIGCEGGKVDFRIITNSTDYVMKKYDGPEEAFPWAPVTYDQAKKIVSFDVKANEVYDERSAYVKFTVNDILVPEYDDNGELTGNMIPAVYRAYVYQEGKASTVWNTNFTENIALASTHTIAKFGDKVYVANALAGSSLFVFDAKTGAAEGSVNLSDINATHINSIALDDAGNLILAFGGELSAPFDIYRVNAGSAITKANATKLISYANGFYGYGLDNIKVTGNAAASAAISAVSAVGYDGGSYVVSWQITNGACAESESYSGCAVLPTGAAVWYSGDMVAQHTTSDINAGVLYMGYDSHYDICYNPSLAGEWAHIYTAGVSGWGENLAGMDVVEWNSKKYVVYIANTFFPEWGMASYVGILGLNNDAPVSISISEHYNAGGVLFGSTDAPNERTGDVCAVVEDGSLALYIVDGGNAFIKKMVFPVLN